MHKFGIVKLNADIYKNVIIKISKWETVVVYYWQHQDEQDRTFQGADQRGSKL